MKTSYPALWLLALLSLFCLTASAQGTADITLASFGGSAVVSFDAQGKPSAGGTANLKYGSRTGSISVNANTGEVTATW